MSKKNGPKQTVKPVMTILVTGSVGMVGSRVIKELLIRGFNVIGVDRKESNIENFNYIHDMVNLSDMKSVELLFDRYAIDKVIHLAAIAHPEGEQDLSYEKYYLVNVTCAENVFLPAAKRHIPILFSSTLDVYGITKGVVSHEAKRNPVGSYAKTKVLAEDSLIRLCSVYGNAFAIFRFAPIYTEEIKRDIEKRYYLKPPKIAYIIGKGSEYELLDIRYAVKLICDWTEKELKFQSIQNVHDEKRVNTKNFIYQEKSMGRAKILLYFPRWLIVAGFTILRLILGEDDYKVFLLNKAVYPIRSK